MASHELQSLTPNTITSPQSLEREFARIRERGYAIDDEEFAPGLCCLAVPFDAGASPFVLALSAPRDRFIDKRDDYLRTMRQIVAGSGNGVSED
jgi:IclR family acetate operon transcriptional repressor